MCQVSVLIKMLSTSESAIVNNSGWFSNTGNMKYETYFYSHLRIQYKHKI